MVRRAEALRRPVRPARERPAFGPAPKEQPPRKLSGKRTARDVRALWKAGRSKPALTEGGKPRPVSASSVAANLSGPTTEGAPQPSRKAGPGCRNLLEDVMIESALKRTPLHDLHLELGAKMVPFAGYDMPVQYPTGILTEHLHTRAAGRPVRRLAYGPAPPHGQARWRQPRGALERVVTCRYRRACPRPQRYALFTNEAGGILDDLMVTDTGDHLDPGGQCRLQGGRSGASARPYLRGGRDRASRLARFAGAAGTGGGEVLARPGAGLPGDALHAARRLDHRGRALLRHPLRLYRRGRLRDFAWPAMRPRRLARRLLAEPEVMPDRARRARFPAARSRALPLRP